jgi:hypothetical protein
MLILYGMVKGVALKKQLVVQLQVYRGSTGITVI